MLIVQWKFKCHTAHCNNDCFKVFNTWLNVTIYSNDILWLSKYMHVDLDYQETREITLGENYFQHSW